MEMGVPDMRAAVLNKTPFPSMRFSNTDNRGHEFGVVMVKAALDIGEDGTCTASPEQEPFNFTDKCHGDYNVSSLRHPSDLVSYKPGTDLIVDAISYPPHAPGTINWLAEIALSDRTGERLRKKLTVCGPRQWVPRWRRRLSDTEAKEWRRYRRDFVKWELSEPEPAPSVPIWYEYACGGQRPIDIGESNTPRYEVCEENPIGCGWLHPEWSDHTVRHAAAQIECPDHPITDPYARSSPAGFGPIPPAWLPRRPLGGTFDQNWIDAVWPRWPADYDFAYNNSAARGLSTAGFVEGSFRIDLHNLRATRQEWSLNVPDLTPTAVIEDPDGKFQFYRMPLDTVFVDIRPEDLFDCRVLLTWRLPFHELTSAIVNIHEMDTAELLRRIRQVEYRQPPHPHDCAIPIQELENAT